MIKVTSTFIAAAAALALSGGAYAQTAGGSGDTSNTGAMPGPATSQMNNGTSGYGMPGATNSDAGTRSLAPPNSPQQQSTNTSPAHTSGPKSNNSLATPSVISPADQQ